MSPDIDPHSDEAWAEALVTELQVCFAANPAEVRATIRRAGELREITPARREALGDLLRTVAQMGQTLGIGFEQAGSLLRAISENN